jgi:hypothetical protein
MGHCNRIAAAAIGVLVVAGAILSAGISPAKTAKSGSFYQVDISTTTSGDSVVATIRVTGKGGYGCNTLYPWKLTVTPGSGVEMDKTVYHKGDATQFAKEAVVFQVRYTALAGADKVTAKLKFSFCNDKQCQMEQVDLSWPAR